MYVTYALKDPRDSSVFYVGITEDVFKRFLSHINCSGNNLAKNMKITELRAANRLPIMEVIEDECPRSDAEAKEAFWVKEYQRQGQPLTNLNKSVSAHVAKKINLLLSVRSQQSIAASYTPMVEQVESKPGVSEETKKIILRMYRAGDSLRKIAEAVGLNGRNYKLFQAVCAEIGIKKVEGM